MNKKNFILHYEVGSVKVKLGLELGTLNGVTLILCLIEKCQYLGNTPKLFHTFKSVYCYTIDIKTVHTYITVNTKHKSLNHHRFERGYYV